MKAYGRTLNGQERFVFLVAYIVKGKVGVEVALGDVRRRWSKMKSLLGKFNRSFTIRARENGWVDTKKKGIYVLTPSWKGALTQKNG